VPEIPYLLAVVALWFLVGYFREPAKQRKLNPSRTTGSSKTIPVGSMVWEVILLLFSLLQIREAFRGWGFRFWRTFNLTAALNVPLYAMWAVVLIRFGLQALETLNRPNQHEFLIGQQIAVLLGVLWVIMYRETSAIS